jgi:hypothetical protein
VTLSVVVSVVDGGAALERCLTALAVQADPPPLEILLPCDDTVSAVTALAARFPQVRCVNIGRVATHHAVSSPAGQHELIDQRRAAGLAAATGDLVAMLSDRCIPHTDWARTAVRLHAALPHAVIGGSVDNALGTTLGWADFLRDFGRYQPPFEAGPREYVTNVNIAYKRRALEATRHLWQSGYHETTVHWALRRAGETLFLSPELRVDHRRAEARLGTLLSERFSFGRLFAFTRARESGWVRRLALTALSPLLPFVLLGRQARTQLAPPRPPGRFLRVAPALLLLLAAWSAGEAVGYLTGRP